MLALVSSAAPVLTPRERQPGGCSVAPVQPELTAEAAVGLASVVKALADPTRLRIFDVIRLAAPEAVCQCELLPLFRMSQPALARHLKVLVSAGVLASQRQGAWTYYHARPGGLELLTSWLS